MSYCTGKNIENARGKALKMLLIEKKPVNIVANHYGVNRTTIWRWYKKWIALNHKEEEDKECGRCQHVFMNICRSGSCVWVIPSLSAAPIHPKTLPEDLIQLVLDIRDQLKRCAEIVWYHINTILCISISLSSVRRILKQYGKLNKTKYHKNRSYKGIARPKVLLPGDLVEIDTIHLYNPITKGRRYIYTVIDLYTRMSYARVYKELKPSYSANVIEEAEEYFGFKFKMVQSDNGLEFGKWFADRLKAKDIQIRHTRLGRPNDNAHIERFNRTLQEECTGNYYLESESLKTLDDKILSYIDFYNYRRIHLSISYRTPSEMLHRS